MFFRKFIFGDAAVYYAEVPFGGQEGKTTVGLAIFPADTDVEAEKLPLDSMVQVAFTGDESLVDYTNGVSMRNRSSTLLRVLEQRADETGVETDLTDGAGNFYTHRLRCDKYGVFSCEVEYFNRTGRARTLESLQSFSLGGISSAAGRSTEGFVLHRMVSAWSRECRLQSLPFSALGLEPSWAHYGVRCERWGQAGSMSNRGYYPFAAVEGGGIVWGATVEAPYSWQFELYQEKETCSLSGGLGDFETAHWQKAVENGESFCTHRAYFTVKRDLYAVFNALLHSADARLEVPADEREMPVLFNEYCTTWGCPSQENIHKILHAIKPFPIGTFVIDCGWYKPDDKGWCNAIGDWRESAALFPQKIKAVTEGIRAAGMRAGIWFEYEVAGRDSACFWNDKLLLTRGGQVITAKNRRFLDLRKEEVQAYLSEKVLRFLRENGFGYIKIDYNDAYWGCDGAESYGEGGRQVAEESIAYLDKIKAAVPEIVIENCASGGSRIEPLRMGKVSMCSFSDAHECAEIPLVAANVSRVVPARQIQIWAVLRDGESHSRTVYSLCAAMIGRICLSGDVLNLDETKIRLIRDGLDFYAAVKEIVRDGDIIEIDCNVESYRDPVGRQIYIKEKDGRRLIIVHRFKNTEKIRIEQSGYKLICAYTDCEFKSEGGSITLFGGEFTAGAFLFERE